jgi:AraC-like DNA-binding protein
MSIVASQSVCEASQMPGAFRNAFKADFSVEATGDGFAGRFNVRDFGRIRVAQMAFSPHRTRRARISRSAWPSLLFNRQVSGRLLVHQDGRAAEIGPGDMYMLNPARDFELETESIEVHAIAIDASLLRGVFPEADCCAAIRLQNEGAASLFSSVIDSLVRWAPTMDKLAEAQMTQAIPHLMAAALCAGLDIRQPSPSRMHLLHKERIKAFARDRLADSELSCEMIAAGLQLSQRYIYDVLRDEPLSLMRWIRKERLARCGRELASPVLQHRSIREIAYAWGFVELAHFSRAFSAQFGQSPRAYRKACLAGPGRA